jgi:hypothetical protein
VLAEEIARADVRQVEVLLQTRGLCALAGARRAEEDEVELAQGGERYFKKPS